MRATRRLTLSAMLAALGVVLLALGSLIELFDIAFVMLASFLILFAMIELRVGYAALTYLVTAALAFVTLSFVRLVPWMYLLFGGLYPILKHYLDRLPPLLSYPVKVLLFGGGSIGVYLLASRVLGVAVPYEGWMLLGLLCLAVLTLLIYDHLLEKLVGYYFARIRPKIKRFLD